MPNNTRHALLYTSTPADGYLLHQDPLSAYLDADATYICTSYNPRCFIIQKVTANPNHVAALNPDADSFETKNSPEETTNATTNWNSAPESEYPPAEGYVYMNGDIGKLPSGAVYPATPDPLASAASTSSDFGPVNGVAGGEQLEVYAQPGSPPGGAQAEPPSGGNAGIPLDQLKHLLSTQLEYYFSRENLANDTYLLSQMDNDQYVPIWTVANFNQVKRLTKDIKLITEVLRESPNVQVDEEGQKVRPNHKRCIVILREIPDNTPLEEVKALFSGEGCPKLISCEFAHNNSWYVTFESDEDAQKAYRFLREEVREFQGKPIMARIKAKPMNRLPMHPAAVAPSIGAQLKNGFRSPPAPAIYDPTAYQTGQHPGRFLYTNGTSIPPTVNYGNQVHVYTFQQQPFYPPSMLAPWGPPSPAYFDIGSVFSVNGLTPQGFTKPPNSRFMPRNRKRNPVGTDRQSLPDTSTMPRQHNYHYSASNNSGNNSTASGVQKSIPSSISVSSNPTSGAKPPLVPSSTVSNTESAHLMSNHHHSKSGGINAPSGPVTSNITTGGNSGNVTVAASGVTNTTGISSSQGLISEGVESSSATSQIQSSSTRTESDENLYRNRDSTNKDQLSQRKPWLARRRRKDDEQLTTSRVGGNNGASSGSASSSGKMSGVGVPGAESGGSPAGGGSGSGGSASASAVGQFDLEASAFPPLPGLEQPATASSKHHHHHHHYTHHHHHHNSGSAIATTTTTTTSGSNSQNDTVSVDQPNQGSHWGENRLADVVKGTAKSNKSQVGTSCGTSTSKEGLPSLPANPSINPSSSPSCPSPRATSPAVTMASALPTPIASAAVSTAPVTPLPTSQPSQLSTMQTSGDKDSIHEINYSSTTLTPPSSPDNRTVPVVKNMADKSTKTDEVLVNGGESSSMTVVSQTLAQSSTPNTPSIASLTPYTMSVTTTTSTTSISSSSSAIKLHPSVVSSPTTTTVSTVINSTSNVSTSKPIPTTTNAATMTSAVVVTDVTSGSSTTQTSTNTTNSRSTNSSASSAFVANTNTSTETCLNQQENACPGRLSYAQVAQHHREKAERLLRDKGSISTATNAVTNDQTPSGNPEKDSRSSNERRKDSASSVQNNTGSTNQSANSNPSASGSSRVPLHGDSREAPQHRDFLGAARYVGRGVGGGSRSSGPSGGGRGTRRDATGGGSSGVSSGSVSNNPGTRFRESLQRPRSPK